MKDSTRYFRILDLNLIGKMEDYVYYLYNKENGWTVDDKHIVSDRLFGYDEIEEPDSPYRIGSTDMLSRIEEITEEEALELINNM